MATFSPNYLGVFLFLELFVYLIGYLSLLLNISTIVGLSILSIEKLCISSFYSFLFDINIIDFLNEELQDKTYDCYNHPNNWLSFQHNHFLSYLKNI